MNKNIFEQMNRKVHVILFLLGFIVFALGIYTYIQMSIIELNIDTLIGFVLSTEMLFGGAMSILANFNYKNIYVKLTITLIAVLLTLSIVAIKPLIYIPISVFILGIVLVLIINFFHVFVTGITLSIYIVVWLICGILIGKSINMLENRFIYSCLTLCLFTYLPIFTKLNKIIIKNLYQDRLANLYTYDVLKDDLMLIYTAVFILLNVFDLINDTFFSCINNSFLTAIAIFSIKWNRIFNNRNSESE